MTPLAKRVQISLHDVTPAHLEELEEFHRLIRSITPDGYSMLVIPDYHGEHPLDGAPEFCEWLREKMDEGVEMVLHGYAPRPGKTDLGEGQGQGGALHQG